MTDVVGRLFRKSKILAGASVVFFGSRKTGTTLLGTFLGSRKTRPITSSAFFGSRKTYLNTAYAFIFNTFLQRHSVSPLCENVLPGVENPGAKFTSKKYTKNMAINIIPMTYAPLVPLA